jgi:hypothetical protein
MGANEAVAKPGNGSGELSLHGLLGRPADLVGGLAQIAIGEEEDGFLRKLFHQE